MTLTPTVAIVGRPNVGKSTLFNRLVGKRHSIVHDMPGVTRDRIVALCDVESVGPEGEAVDRKIQLVDTGGLVLGDDPLGLSAQVFLAVEESDLLVFVVDGKQGLTAADEVVIPLQCESLSQRGVGQLLETIEDVRDYTNEDLEVRGAIATLFDGRTKLAHQVVQQVRKEYGIKVLEPYVPKSVKVAEAPARGRSVLTHAPNSRSAEAYRELANQIYGRKGQ